MAVAVADAENDGGGRNRSFAVRQAMTTAAEINGLFLQFDDAGCRMMAHVCDGSSRRPRIDSFISRAINWRDKIGLCKELCHEI